MKDIVYTPFSQLQPGDTVQIVQIFASFTGEFEDEDYYDFVGCIGSILEVDKFFADVLFYCEDCPACPFGVFAVLFTHDGELLKV